MNIESISSRELLEKNDFSNYKTSSWFCHYTSVKTLNSILNGNKLFFSNAMNFNDKNEVKLYQGKGEDVFVFCFCNSKTEKIPMWYLYAGITGQGARFRFTTSKLRDFINSIKTIFPVSNFVVQTENKLSVNQDFVVKSGWVYYKKDKQTIKYNNIFYWLVKDPEEFYKENFVIKDYEWEYEKEFRIIILLKDGVRKSLGFTFDRVAVDFHVEDIKISLAPESGHIDFSKGYEGFQKYFASSIEPSKLNICMDLLQRNIESFINFCRTPEGKKTKNKVCNE